METISIILISLFAVLIVSNVVLIVVNIRVKKALVEYEKANNGMLEFKIMQNHAEILMRLDKQSKSENKKWGGSNRHLTATEYRQK